MDGNGRWATAVADARRRSPRRRPRRPAHGRRRAAGRGAHAHALRVLRRQLAPPARRGARPHAALPPLPARRGRALRRHRRAPHRGRTPRPPRPGAAATRSGGAGSATAAWTRLTCAPRSTLGARGARGRRRAPAGRLADPRADLAARLGAAMHDAAPASDVDLLIRTGGERRSDFLLWECAYASSGSRRRCGRDSTPDELRRALADFAAASALRRASPAAPLRPQPRPRRPRVTACRSSRRPTARCPAPPSPSPGRAPLARRRGRRRRCSATAALRAAVGLNLLVLVARRARRGRVAGARTGRPLRSPRCSRRARAVAFAAAGRGAMHRRSSRSPCLALLTLLCALRAGGGCNGTRSRWTALGRSPTWPARRRTPPASRSAHRRRRPARSSLANPGDGRVRRRRALAAARCSPRPCARLRAPGLRPIRPFGRCSTVPSAGAAEWSSSTSPRSRRVVGGRRGAVRRVLDRRRRPTRSRPARPHAAGLLVRARLARDRHRRARDDGRPSRSSSAARRSARCRCAGCSAAPRRCRRRG